MFEQSARRTRNEDVDADQDNKALDRMPLPPITLNVSQYKVYIA